MLDDSLRDWDFTVFPALTELSSPQPIKPLQIGAELTYEITLTNQGDTSTFTSEVDVPLTWSYSLSNDTGVLHTGESVTVLLTVTSPQEIPLQDHTVRLEATSLEDSQMTACLDLIASSKQELAAETMTMNCEEEVVTLAAFVSNGGLMDAENVKVQVFNGPPSENDLLGEQTMRVPSGETATTSIRCTLPDGLYTFYIIVDPDNLIIESCESNNEQSIHYLLDRTPPEAEIFFDPEMEDLVMRGVDNLDSSLDVSVTEKVIKNKRIRTYTIIDDAKNTTELQLEIKKNKHEIKAEIIAIRYSEKSADIPSNSFKIEYVIEDGKVKLLNQFLIIGDTKVHLIYNGNRDETKVLLGAEEIQEGLRLVIIRTDEGDFQYQIEKIR